MRQDFPTKAAMFRAAERTSKNPNVVKITLYTPGRKNRKKRQGMKGETHGR